MIEKEEKNYFYANPHTEYPITRYYVDTLTSEQLVALRHKIHETKLIANEFGRADKVDKFLYDPCPASTGDVFVIFGAFLLFGFLMWGIFQLV